MAHLLVVDDEPSARTTLALLLRKRGHRVVEADGATSAAAKLAEEAFDLVVTDLRMPDGDGLEVLRAAKAQVPAPEVILLTAYAEWKSAKEAIRQPAFMVLTFIAAAWLICSIFVSYFTFGEDIKMYKDTGLTTISFVGLLLALLTASSSVAVTSRLATMVPGCGPCGMPRGWSVNDDSSTPRRLPNRPRT